MIRECIIMWAFLFQNIAIAQLCAVSITVCTADGGSQHSMDLFFVLHNCCCLACATDVTVQLISGLLWAVQSSLDFGTLATGIKVSNHAITTQQSIDSKIDRIVLKDIVALHLHCSFLPLLFSHCREIPQGEKFRQLNISYFKFTSGFNFYIVQYARIHYSIAQKFSFAFNFRMHVNLRK